jgi:hypothetical protein
MDLHALSDKMPIRYGGKGRDRTTFLPNKVYLPTREMAQAESVEIIHFHLKASGGLPR